MGYLALVVVLCISIALAVQSARGSTVLTFGQTAPLTGTYDEIGTELRRGILTAFMEVNETVGPYNGIYYDLIALDDQLNPIIANNNTKSLVQDNDIFGLVGLGGQFLGVAALSALQELNRTEIPLIGTATGASSLRVPFQRNVINVRSSNIDESVSMVNFITKYLELSRISVLYQNDSLGVNGYNVVLSALRLSGLQFESEASFDATNEDVQPALDVIFADRAQPEAVILLGTFSPMANAIRLARAAYTLGKTCAWVTGTILLRVDDFARQLHAYGENLTGIYVTSPVPPAADDSIPIVRRYKAAKDKYFPGSISHPFGLEGYITGLFVTEVVMRIRGPITRQNFIDTIYSSSVFVIGDRVVGPYDDGSSTMPCNQGLREIYLTLPLPDGNYTLHPESGVLTWEGCMTSTTSAFNVTRLKWGQTAALSGINQDMGIEVSRGILAAFAEANKKSRVPNVFFDLVVHDDAYDPVLAASNTLDLVSSRKVFGLIGSIGTPTVAATLNTLASLGINPPIVGAVTGAEFLRVPFRKNIINIRASYIDETAAIVNFLTGRLITRIAIFYQQDAFGQAGYDGLTRALNASGLDLESEGFYTRGTLDVEAGMAHVLSKSPEAIVMIGAYAPLAKAVWYGRNYNTIGADATYLSVSFVAADSFRAQLQSYNLSLNNIFVTQVVPPPADTSYLAVENFAAALQAMSPHASLTFAGLEGYLIGSFVIETVEAIQGKITPDSFINTVYQKQIYSVGQIRLGPYISSAAVVSTLCNQGMKRVWVTEIDTTGIYGVVPESDFEWSGTCISTSANLLRPLVFGQSAPLTGSISAIGLKMRSGILLAFERTNKVGGIDGRPIKLITYDDGYDSARTKANTAELINAGAVGLIGYVGTEPSLSAVPLSTAANIPFLAPYTGATSLRTPCSKEVIHVRASYADEIGAIISFLVDAKFSGHRNARNFSRIAMLYQNDDFGISAYKAAVLELEYRNMSLVGSATYQRNTFDVVSGAIAIAVINPKPQVVVAVCTYGPCSAFVTYLNQANIDPNLVFVLLSSASANEFAAALGPLVTVQDSSGNPTIYISQCFPNPTDTHYDIVVEYVTALIETNSSAVPNYVEFEGFMAGRFAIRAMQVVSDGITRSSIVDTIFDYPVFNIKGLILGPYTLDTTSGSNSCTCNQGGHEVWMTYLNTNRSVVNVPSWSFRYDTCGYSFLGPSTPAIPTVFGADVAGPIVGGVIGSLAILTIIALIVVLILRKQGYFDSKHPIPELPLDQIEGELPPRNTSSSAYTPTSSNVSHNVLINSSAAGSVGGVSSNALPPVGTVEGGWKDEWLIPEEEIILTKKIGSGGYGTVYKGTWKGVKVAIKQTVAGDLDDQAIALFKREARLMLSIRPHPNLLAIYGVSLSDKVLIVVEYCKLGALSSHFGTGTLTKPLKERIIRDLAAGLAHLHDCNVVHRDVASRNILLHTGHQVKLSDFGMARVVDKMTKEHTTASNVGPIKYMAPESLKRRKFSFASDVYTFGVVIVEIWTETPPFKDMDMMDAALAIRDNGLTPTIPSEMPRYLKKICEYCWHKDHKARPTMRELVKIIQLEGPDTLADS